MSTLNPMGLTTAGDLRPQEIPHEIVALAQRLARIHGAPLLTQEASGRHIYLASPAALETYGSEELDKRNLSINVDKHFGIGKWRQFIGTYDTDKTGYCFKTQTPYRVSELLAMRPLEERGYPVDSVSIEFRIVERYLIDDGAGHMIPDHPGTVTPITKLPANHVAVQYLRERGYDPAHLEAQFGCAYCHTQTPERWLDKSDPARLVYRPLPGGFKDTSQGRIIFYAYINGVQVGWQARVIDKWVGDCHYYWHPYDNTWSLVEIRVGTDAATGKPQTVRCPPFNTEAPFTWDNPKWDVSKYKTGKGVSRQELVMGLDAAVAWNLVQGRKRRIGIGSEGPLDAGRFRSPGIALIGKELSEAQVRLILKNFDEFIWVGDQDVAGRKASVKIHAELGPKIKLHEVLLPTGVKDAGELRDDDALALVKHILYP